MVKTDMNACETHICLTLCSRLGEDAGSREKDRDREGENEF